MTTSGLTTEDFLVALGDNQNHNFSQVQKMLITMEQRLVAMESQMGSVVSAIGKFEILMMQTLAKDPSGAMHSQAGSSLATGLKMNFQKVNLAAAMPASSFALKPEDDDSSDENFEEEPEKIGNEIFCYDCKKSFTRGSGEFTRHLKASLCKPYQCKCGKLFRKKSSLTTHKSTHSKATLACYCGSIFRCEQYLKNHQRRVHGATGTPDHNAARFMRSKRSSSPLESIEKRSKTDEANDDAGFDPIDLLNLHFNEPEA